MLIARVIGNVVATQKNQRYEGSRVMLCRQITPEGDASQVYVGRVLRRAGLFGARRLQSDDPSQRADERVVEVVVSADEAPFLIGQRVLVKFMKPGETAGAEREVSVGVGPDQAMRTP